MYSKNLWSAVVTVVLFTLITGLVYPLLVTGLAQLLFSDRANGSFMNSGGKVVGSELIGQSFSDPEYFWGRLSATSPFAYNAGASTGSNYGPLNPALLDVARKRIQDLKNADPSNSRPIPVDLVTASASGLDPHISVAAALYQLPRVARDRKMSEEQVRSLLNKCAEGRQWGFLGESRVNVLKLNIALDGIQPVSERK